MGRIVQKYGGSSVADAESIKRVARRIARTRADGHEVIIVISAMGDATDELMDLALKVSPNPKSRELDMLLTTGERQSAALLAMALADLGVEAVSYTGSQAGILTTPTHGNARIIDITPGRVVRSLEEGSVVIVAGFQGVAQTTKDVTTLGRGASDTTAVALASALGADHCEIYTDVDGVYTADPRIVPSARRITEIGYEEMMELAASGAKILHLRCVEYARRENVKVHVRSSFSDKPGTWVKPHDEVRKADKMEEDIIQPVDRRLLKSELTPEKQLRMTNKSHNEIYIVTAQNSPHVMKEIGRLREIAFRNAGGGTGKAVDIDEFDTMDGGYKQLIVWNPDAEDIIGGYRFIYGTDWKMNADGQPLLATSHMFKFSNRFLTDYMPYTVELGRSFVAVEYQSIRKGTKSIFALDNLWDGLGALTVINPKLKYFFGKMTMYPSYIRRGRDMILYFLKKHFDDKENLITPMKPLIIETDPKELETLFSADDFKEDYKILNREIRALGYNIPPLVNAYMGLSPTMKLFGTAINNGFGDVEETGILIAVDEILEEKRVRHIDSFITENRELLELTTGQNKIIYKEK